MILGRRGRLFGDTRKSAFVREQEGGGGVIYGLQFNGISDYIRLSSLLTAPGDFYMEWAAKQNRTNNTVLTGGAVTFNNSIVTRGITIQDRIVINGAVYDFNSNWLEGGSNVFSTYRIQRTGVTLELFRDGNLIDSASVVGTAFELEYWATRSDLISFFEIEGLSYIDFNGTLLNDSNNWGGATINGATRVQSTDGGLIWTPA